MLAIEYLRTAPRCFEGQGGSDQLWAVALRLVRKLQLPLEVCHELLADYNQRCVPPWTYVELQHKLVGARDESDITPGIAPVDFMQKSRERVKALAPEQDGVPAAAGGKLIGIDISTLSQMLYNDPDWEGVLCFNLLTRQPVALHPPVQLRMTHGAFSDGDVTK